MGHINSKQCVPTEKERSCSFEQLSTLLYHTSQTPDERIPKTSSDEKKINVLFWRGRKKNCFDVTKRDSMRPHNVISNSGRNLSLQACSRTYPGKEKKIEKIGINTCPTYAASSCYKIKTSTIIVFLKGPL